MVWFFPNIMLSVSKPVSNSYPESLSYPTPEAPEAQDESSKVGFVQERARSELVGTWALTGADSPIKDCVVRVLPNPKETSVTWGGKDGANSVTTVFPSGSRSARYSPSAPSLKLVWSGLPATRRFLSEANTTRYSPGSRVTSGKRHLVGFDFESVRHQFSRDWESGPPLAISIQSG